MHLIAIPGKAREARLLGESGAGPPRKFFDFRPSEIVSGAVFLG